MKQPIGNNMAKFLQQATLLMACCIFAASAAYGQGGGPGGNSGQCLVTQIRLRIVTGGDDLRGGKDNLNIQILFAGGRAPQVALNVNKSQNWPNNSTNTVAIPLNQPVPPNQIIGFRLIHIADGGFNFNSLPSVLTPAAPWEIPQAFLSPDNWDMSLLQVAAIGNGVGARIAGHGFNRFTGSNPVLTVATHVPVNACGSGRPTGNSGGGSGGTGSGVLNSGINPGGSGLHSVTGGSSGSGGPGSTGAETNRTLQPLIPRGRSNSASGSVSGGGSGAAAQYGRNVTGVVPGPPTQGGTQPWQKNRIVIQALTRAIPIGPKPSAPSELGSGSNSAIIAKLRQQSAAARPLLAPAFTGGVRPAGTPTGGPAGATLLAGGANQNPTLLNGTGGASQGGTLLNGGSARADDLSPQPYPPKGSPAQVGPSQTMSAQGSTPIGTAAGSQATTLTPNGPQRQQPTGGQHPAPSLMTRAATAKQAQTQVCINGIGTVDGQKSRVYFSPISGPEGTFVIQGCGFGTTPGQVYLSGVHYPNTRNRFARLGTPMFPDRVTFQIPPNGWSDRQIVAQIDPNAGGLYDTNNVTLVVKTASGQLYQATGFNFAAAYDFQTLTSVPQLPSAVTLQLAAVNDSTGSSVLPLYETPWIYSSPQHTLGVDRNRISFTFPGSYTFPGGTDTYQFHFAPGFRLANNGVQLYHSDLTLAACQTGGNGQYQYAYSTNGNWGINYTSPSSFQISWQEQGCWPNGKAGDPLDYASVSAYSLWITVWGPRGVSPW
ncbi:MAG TPA: hypothetical protein VGR94_06775 [Candidatus Acidoferrales bacterium]|nr:hypothetical protein [Candidatus Acidoferrales bacterium]HEV2499660.1 hypothetical protein [Terriglobia bacterium]